MESIWHMKNNHTLKRVCHPVAKTGNNYLKKLLHSTNEYMHSRFIHLQRMIFYDILQHVLCLGSGRGCDSTPLMSCAIAVGRSATSIRFPVQSSNAHKARASSMRLRESLPLTSACLKIQWVTVSGTVSTFLPVFNSFKISCNSCNSMLWFLSESNSSNNFMTTSFCFMNSHHASQTLRSSCLSNTSTPLRSYNTNKKAMSSSEGCTSAEKACLL
mmetsp:Transcript_28143/g.45248  ORF Transcript_28143/g.45248 Transcript_28143/m.45248 type:complete len:215 (-) Transcript_28143:234-878(-)